MTTSRQLSQLVPLPTGTGPFAWKPGIGWTSDFGSLFRIEHVQAASVGQTVFTIPNGYSLPLVLVWFNGALLIPSEYTATNGTSVTLVRGADATTDVLSVGVLYAVPTAGDALLTYTTATLPPAATNQAHIFWNSDLPGPVYSNGTSWLPLAGAGLGAVAVEDVVPISKGGTGSITAETARAAIGVPAQNLLINTDFTVNQRRFAGGTLAAGAYGYDRWGAYAAGASYSVLNGVVTITSGNICQPIEAPAAAGLPMTVSVDSLTANLSVVIGNGTGANSASGIITAGAGRRSITLVVPATVTGDVQVRFGGSNVSFSRPKAEIGNSATAYVKSGKGVDFQECARFFWRQRTPDETGAAAAGIVTYTTGATAVVAGTFPFLMRSAPAITSLNIRFLTGGVTTSTDATISVANSSVNSYRINFAAGATLPNPSAIIFNTADAHVSFDAELACNV